VSAASRDTTHWGYLFAAFAHFYGWDWRKVMEMTPRQTRHYLAMIRYVSADSPDAGIVPPLPSAYLDAGDLRREVSQVGVPLPDTLEPQHVG